MALDCILSRLKGPMALLATKLRNVPTGLKVSDAMAQFTITFGKKLKL